MSDVEVVKDEVDRRRDYIREKRAAAREVGDDELYRRWDPLAVEMKSRKWRPKWVNTNHYRVDQYRYNGYELAKPEDVRWMAAGQPTVENTVRFKELVLMVTPWENYERRRARALYKQRRQQRAGIDSAMDNLNRIARDGGLAKPHTNVAFDESTEGEPFESGTRQRYDQSGKAR